MKRPPVSTRDVSGLILLGKVKDLAPSVRRAIIRELSAHGLAVYKAFRTGKGSASALRGAAELRQQVKRVWPPHPTTTRFDRINP